MNPWIQRSLEIAQRQDYLDQLSEIYAIPHELRRPIDSQNRREIEKLFHSRDWAGLIRLLLRLQKFPYQEPFLGCLRADQTAIERNPRTVQRVSRILLTMGTEGIIEGVEEPPQANRQLGSLFKRWLRTLPYPHLTESDFGRSPEVAILSGSNGKLMKFANTELGCALGKRPDLVAKTPGGYVVAEAKFITTPGGNQDKSFREVIQFIRTNRGNAIRIGVLDGVVWLERGGLYGTIRETEENALSALLLRRFLESLR